MMASRGRLQWMNSKPRTASPCTTSRHPARSDARCGLVLCGRETAPVCVNGGLRSVAMAPHPCTAVCVRAGAVLREKALVHCTQSLLPLGDVIMSVSGVFAGILGYCGVNNIALELIVR